MYMYIHVYMYFMYNACPVCTYVHADMYMYNIEHAYHMLHVVLVYSTVHVCNYMYKNMCSKCTCTCFIVSTSTRKLHMYCANL